MPTPKYKSEQIEKVAQFSVKHKDVFDLGTLYEAMHEWVIQMGYASRDDLSFGETMFLQRVSGEGAREIWFWWRLSKVPDDVANKAEPRYMYQLRINAHTLGVKKTEIVKDGQKIGADKGEVEIMIEANIVKDPEEAWKKSRLPLFLQRWLWDRHIADDIDKHKQFLLREAYQLGDMLKRYFEMHTLTPEPQGEFFPPKGMQT